jgi:hypothetical protein
LACLDPTNTLFTVLADDVIFYDKLEFTEEFRTFYNNPKILALNFRMGPNITKIFQNRPAERHPKFIKKNLWDWQTAKSRNWHYSMGMCQFHRTRDMIGYLQNLNFNSPNLMEGRMVVNPPGNMPLMLCFDTSKIIELAVNRVQEVSKTNQFGNIDAEQLNNQWLSGKQIKLKPLCKLPKHINRFYDINLEYEDIK